MDSLFLVPHQAFCVQTDNEHMNRDQGCHAPTFTTKSYLLAHPDYTYVASALNVLRLFQQEAVHVAENACH